MNIAQVPALVDAFVVKHVMTNPTVATNPIMLGIIDAGRVVAPNMIMRRLDSMKTYLIESGIVAENGEVNLALAKKTSDAFIARAGKLPVYGLTFDANDLDVLFRMAGEFGNGDQKLA